MDHLAYSLALASCTVLGVALLGLSAYRLRRWYQQRQEKQRTAEAERVRRLLRSWQHHWINEVQVLSGYQQMAQYDQLSAYLRRMTQRAHRDSRLASFPYAPLAVLLVAMEQSLEKTSVQLVVDPSLAQLPASEMQRVFAVLDAVRQDLEKLGLRRLILRIDQVAGGVQLRLAVDAADQILLTGCTSRWQRHLQPLRGTLACEGETVVCMYIPLALPAEEGRLCSSTK